MLLYRPFLLLGKGQPSTSDRFSPIACLEGLVLPRQCKPLLIFMEDKKIYSKFREDEEGSELCHSSLALPDHLLHFSCSTLPLPTMKRWKGQSQQPWIKQAAHAGRNKNSPFHLLSVKHCQAGGDLSTLHLPQVTSAANPVLHDISRVTLYSCPGQQFHLNKQSRKYRKHYSSEQEGKTHCQINTVKRSSQAASAFPTAAYRHFSTEKLQTRTQDPPSPGLQSAAA